MIRRAIGLWLAIVLGAGWAGGAEAHEVRPGYLELTALDAEHWDVLFKVPARGDRRLGLDVLFPESCATTPAEAHPASGAHIERWRAHCPGGLGGATITIGGLATRRTDVLARVRHPDDTTQTVRLTPSAPAFVVDAQAAALTVAVTYLGLGIEHILLGIDHLAFVAALLFLLGDARRLVQTVTAFTVAHSLTLAAAALGWLSVPPAPVEAAIALSIVIVAAEVVHGRDSLARRRPWLVAFAFGLLHGLGFAGALAEVGLPPGAIPTALACFNVGVEIGQLVFIGAVFTLLFAAAQRFERTSDIWRQAARIATPSAYAIGLAGAFWLIQRTASFWSI